MNSRVSPCVGMAQKQAPMHSDYIMMITRHVHTFKPLPCRFQAQPPYLLLSDFYEMFFLYYYS